MGQHASRDPIDSGPFAASRHDETCPVRKMALCRDFVHFISELKHTLKRRESIAFAAPPGSSFSLDGVEEDVLAYKVHVNNVLFHHVYLKCACAGRYCGMDINMLDSRGQAALHVAVRRKDYDMVKLLLNLGSEPHQHNRWGLTALHIACETGDSRTLDLLLQTGVSPNIKESQDLPMFNNVSRTPLILAASHGHLGCITKLLDASAAINMADEAGNTALHKATVYGHVYCAKHLILHGADPNAQNQIGATPLQLSLLQMQSDITESLLKAGSDVRIYSPELPSIVTMAAMMGEMEVFKECLQQGIDVERREGDGKSCSTMTPLYFTFTGNVQGLKDNFPAISNQGIDFDPPFTQLTGRRETFTFLMELGTDVESPLRDALDTNSLTVKHFTLPQNVEMFRAAICACGFSCIPEQHLVNLFWKLLGRNSSILVKLLMAALPLLDLHVRPRLLEAVDWTGTHTDEAVLRYLETAGADADTAAWVHRKLSRPRPLQEWCRQSIRQNLVSRNVTYYRRYLPLPKALQDYVVLADVNHGC